MRVLHVVAAPDADRAADPTPLAEPLRAAGHRLMRVAAHDGPLVAFLHAWTLERPDLVLADAAPGAALAGWLATRVRRAPLVLDARDADWEGPASLPGAVRFVALRASRILAGRDATASVLTGVGVDSGRVLRWACAKAEASAVASGDPLAAASRADDAAEARDIAEMLEGVRRTVCGRDIEKRPGGWYGGARRLLDVVGGLALLLLLAPILVAVAIAIRLDSPGPALFRQRRIGRASSEFTIMKFRTMQIGTPDLASHLMGPGSRRVTRLGRVLRRTSIDELPQLWHLVTGEMTFIGPRPALHNQDDLVAMRQEAGIDALTPGVTGWAQVNGRDDIPLDRKVALDRHYLEHVSPGLDLRILLRTLVVLFSDRGVF